MSLQKYRWLKEFLSKLRLVNFVFSIHISFDFLTKLIANFSLFNEPFSLKTNVSNCLFVTTMIFQVTNKVATS